MKEIKLSCKCGASIYLLDERQVYINPGGSPDDKGRIFVIQIQADEWLDRHENCLKP